MADPPRYHHTWRPHKPANASPEQKSLGWKALNAAAVALGVVIAQRVLTTGWRLVRHQPPPSGPSDRRASLGAALTWATSVGIGLAVARVVAARLSARAWEAALHEAPPTSAEPPG
jgi:hypothetical protein